ncbi:MAG: oleB [Candidatus Brocadiaceae bacterium]|nr:oleB [Candidatus Brocadiaceae bacterium]
MIRLNSICLSFGSDVIFEDVSLHIRRNDRIGLIGKNGAGKSTLFKLLCKTIEPNSGSIISAKDTNVGYLPQEGFVFKNKTVFEEARSAFEDIINLKRQIDTIHARLEDPSLDEEEHQLFLDRYAHVQHQLDVVNGSKVDAETSKVLKGMGFRDADFTKALGELSGGWQMRVALSRLLLQEPNLLLLDEPTNHLDIDSILWLESYLKEFKGGLILISHDRAFLDRNATKIWELERGAVTEYSGNYSFYEVEKENRKELQTARYTNQQKKIKEVERFIERFRAKNTKASQVQSRIHMLEKMEKEELPENDESQVKFKFRESKQSGVTVLEVKEVAHQYEGRFIFRNVSFSIERGERIALVGQNGSGKSTLSRILAGLEQPCSGTIKLGHNVLFDYFAQEHAEKLNNNNTVLQEVESVAPFSMIPQVRHILGAFLFSGDDVFKAVSVLSGGEKSRLSLAKILLKPTNFLLLDEPTNHIDIATKKILKAALLDYAGSLLIVSHDRDFLDGLVTKVFELKDNRLHVHLSGFREFLDAKTESMSLETKSNKGAASQPAGVRTPGTSRTVTDNTTSNTVSPAAKEDDSVSQKQLYLQKKDQNARKRKLTKEAQSIEERTISLEAKKKELDNLLLDPTLYSNKEKAVEVNKQYQSVTQELNTLYKEWEDIHAELESITADELEKK